MMDNDEFGSYWDKYKAEQKARVAEIPGKKDRVLGILHTNGVATVTVGYSGDGDSGQVDDIVGLDANGVAVDLVFAGMPADETKGLHEMIEEFAWDVIAFEHDGFENNDGGFGSLEIDVEARTIKWVHNNNVTTYETTEYEI
jgi:hypothetical protein